MDNRKAKSLVIKAGRELVHSNLIARTWGNVSVRIDRETFAITPSGRNYMTLTEDDIVVVRIKDLSYEGEIKPSSEKRLHREIYKNREDVSFIIHTHQQNGSAVAAMPLNGFEPEGEYPNLGKKVLCSRYALPGTKKFSKNVVAALNKSQGNAILLRYHGVVCFGSSYGQVFETAKSLEEACEKYLAGISPPLMEAGEERREAGEREGEIWNRDPVVMSFLDLETDLFPFSEDFAQMIGWKAPYLHSPEEDRGEAAVLIPGKGALCRGVSRSDAEAVAMLVTKNCKAFFAAGAMGRPKPISRPDVMIMRMVYLKKYEKRKGGDHGATGDRL
ncbi:MAG: class II aldolase/adducin family protein [Anaerovoracaceae bacterium]|jgi:ribulose-5-phosphate 4-epimerase/fuculose-1-phosphate aldolase